MKNSLKIGAVSGLIAGIINGIVFSIFIRIAASLGFFESFRHGTMTTSFESNVIVTIIFGTILGLIYSKCYNIIPGKGILKGLIYGLLLYLFMEIRSQTFWASYGYYLDVYGFIFTSSFSWIAYGLVLGFLYELLHRKYNIPKEKKKIITYSLMSGIIPGAIAGLADGFASSIANLIMYALDIFKLPGAPTALTFEFWLDQSGTHLFINLVWGALFGAMFARFYNLIPSKGILKGLYYSLMVYLFTTVQSSAYEAGWWLGSFSWDAFYIMLWGIFVGFLSTGIALGLVLGALYKSSK